MAVNRRRLVLVGVLVLAALVVGIVVIQLWVGRDRLDAIDEASGDWAYLAVFLLVFGDAVCALFPGETTLNTASALAAHGTLDLRLVMLAGAVGAVSGDATLYWIVRLNRGRFQTRIDTAMKNEKVVAALDVVGSSAPILLVFGRYVPGVRLAVNATFGLAAYPFRSFLVWSAIGGTAWAVYTCGLAYVVATALAGFPLASVVISGIITTVAIAVVFIVVRRRARAVSGVSTP
jgi:membrane-associated protein